MQTRSCTHANKHEQTHITLVPKNFHPLAIPLIFQHAWSDRMHNDLWRDALFGHPFCVCAGCVGRERTLLRRREKGGDVGFAWEVDLDENLPCKEEGAQNGPSAERCVRRHCMFLRSRA